MELTAEIFLRCYENLNIKRIIEDKHIIFYTRYVDGILIMYDHTKITSERIPVYISSLRTNLQFKPTQVK
jgi:hypothetical protein